MQNAAAVGVASDLGAYVLWGMPPFLRLKRQQPIEQPLLLEPLLVADPMLQRMMVAVVVNPASEGSEYNRREDIPIVLVKPRYPGSHCRIPLSRLRSAGLVASRTTQLRT